MGPSTRDGWTLYEPPVYNYQYRVATLHVPVVAGTEPCWVHRKLQTLCLGINWHWIGCNLPPHGWRCTRGGNHTGPCAAHPQGWRKPYWMVRLKLVDFWHKLLEE